MAWSEFPRGMLTLARQMSVYQIAFERLLALSTQVMRNGKSKDAGINEAIMTGANTHW